MLNQIIRFIERDVDGCGSDAEVVVLLKTDLPLTNGHRTRLEHEIESIKREWEDDGWDTDSVVEEAITRAFGEDAEWGIVLPDLEVEF